MIMSEYLAGCSGSREQCGRSLYRPLHALRESVSLSDVFEDRQPAKQPSLEQSNQYLTSLAMHVRKPADQLPRNNRAEQSR